MVVVQNERPAEMVSPPEDGSISALVAELDAYDGVQRRTARGRLVDIGQPATPALIEALASPSRHVRWEAAKALGQIRDPRAAPALVNALEDGAPGVRWLAAEGLIALGQPGLIALLEALEQCSDSHWLREGAHHVLQTLIRDNLTDEAVPVLKALEGIEAALETPAAAHHALQLLRQKNAGQHGSAQKAE